MSEIHRIGLLGFGEVGTILAADLARCHVELCAYDIAFADPSSDAAEALRQYPNVAGAADAATMARGCDLVISAVTAAQDLAGAQSVLPGLRPEALFLDLNSVSPATKRRVAEVVAAAAGRYVEAAVLAPFAPKRLASPILLGGPHAVAFASAAAALGFADVSVCAGEIGRAAAIKMCRSVIVKGLEALVSESLLTARRYRVHEEVLATLTDLLPRPDWNAHARYLIGRSLAHGGRRAEEMQEAADTVLHAGIDPWMSEACVERQAWAAGFAGALEHEELTGMLDAILSGAGSRPTGRASG